MARQLYRLGRLVAAHPVIVLAIWIVAAAGVTALVQAVGAETDNDLSLPGTDASRRPTSSRPSSRRSRTAATRSSSTFPTGA
jgi:uncharacterized membrane protein YdfJ with MMPL/SSD domain